MLTPWGERLDKNNVLKEYPRPQLKRESYLNLNGIWDYAITETADIPRHFDGEILVPFSPESELSGVRRQVQPHEFLWYRLMTELPENFNEGKLLLHFGAVDQIARVWVNGWELMTHVGGFTPFTVDISRAVTDRRLIILVCVQDFTDRLWQSRGKQKSRPGGIWYSPQSGIWQSVWLESVPENYIRGLRIKPRFDSRQVELWVAGEGSCGAVIDGREYTFEAGRPAVLDLDELHPWSPEDPYLYSLSLTLGRDRVESYFAMRKFSVDTDEHGTKRLFLNNEPYFHNGLLDQGYWSDGMLTAPSDEAMIFDIQTAKDMGFNMLRKHIKIEPLRWYYHCDRIGMLVWQDMPNGGGRYSPAVVSAPLFTGIHLRDNHYRLFGRGSLEGRTEYFKELREMLNALYNCPCIAMWVPFNEGWGQFDSAEVCRQIMKVDSSRTIDHASGWHDQRIGDIRSWHVYFKKYHFTPDAQDRAVVLSEFGGYSHRVDGHCVGSSNFGYKRFDSANSFKFALKDLYAEQIRPAWEQGLAAAVYTQLSDVENELNGLITYDRRVVKLAPAIIKSFAGGIGRK